MDSILKSDNSVEAVLQYSPVVLFIIMLYKVALTFESVDEILKFDYSNKSYWVESFCGAIGCTWDFSAEAVDFHFDVVKFTFRLQKKKKRFNLG